MDVIPLYTPECRRFSYIGLAAEGIHEAFELMHRGESLRGVVKDS